MKVLVNSLYLAQMLSKFDFDREGVEWASGANGELILESRNHKVALNVDISGAETNISQIGTRYDWVLKTCRKVGDMPMVLDITKDHLTITITF